MTLIKTKKLYVVSQILGHHDYQNDNIMYLILHDLIVSLIDNNKNNDYQVYYIETLNKYLKMLSETITKCVIATNQTYVDNLKKDKAFTKEAQQEALKMTADAVLAILSDEAKTYLPTIVGDLNTYILTQIESEVNRLK